MAETDINPVQPIEPIKRTRRPRRVVDDSLPATPMSKAHHMVRNIVVMPNPADQSQVTGAQADILVESWFSKGYRLFATHFVGVANSGPIVMWIFIK